MDKMTFVENRNVVVFEHLMVSVELRKAINCHISDPLDERAAAEVKRKLDDIVNAKIGKYSALGMKQQIKLVYLFLMEGIQGIASGETLADEQEAVIKEYFNQVNLTGGSPVFKVIGISELRPIFAQVEARVPGVRLAGFLLKEDGKGSYDSPKIAASLIQLARRSYVRDEIFIRIDDDVMPTADGIRHLKESYYELTHDSGNNHFCISWNYVEMPLGKLALTQLGGPDYKDLFKHFVNSYSIRTTYLAAPPCACRFNPAKGQMAPLQSRDSLCRINIVHAMYFIKLFQAGKWGSSLSDPISGAGMCFSAHSLVDLPPWCNANELITWIDDFVKWQLMSVYYGDNFVKDRGLLSAEGIPGFGQNRNDPQSFKVKDVEWSTNTYLDRLLMGCILSFCIEPFHYGTEQGGFGELLKERDYLTALHQWRSGLSNQLKKSATEHIRKVLQDWHHYFCAKRNESQPGYITESPQTPGGFAPAPADGFFNAYTLKQLLAIDTGTFDLVDKVFHVLERYLEMKYQFWSHVVATTDTFRRKFELAMAKRTEVPNAIESLLSSPVGWLFTSLDTIGNPSERQPSRTSSASVALIEEPELEGERSWLMQWNAKWNVMNLISGHREAYDVNDLACVMRELHEELFDGLQEEDLESMNAAIREVDEYERSRSSWKNAFIDSITKSDDPPHDYSSYMAFSKSTNQWTRYEFKVYRVRLTDEGWRRIFQPNPFFPSNRNAKPEGPNEWVSVSDMHRGWTRMGRPISETARAILERGFASTTV